MSALRVGGLPDAAQLVRLDAAAAGELQQLLDVVEDGGLVVGEGQLHLPRTAQAGHLQDEGQPWGRGALHLLLHLRSGRTW